MGDATLGRWAWVDQTMESMPVRGISQWSLSVPVFRFVSEFLPQLPLMVESKMQDVIHPLLRKLLLASVLW